MSDQLNENLVSPRDTEGVRRDEGETQSSPPPADPTPATGNTATGNNNSNGRRRRKRRENNGNNGNNGGAHKNAAFVNGEDQNGVGDGIQREDVLQRPSGNLPATSGSSGVTRNATPKRLPPIDRAPHVDIPETSVTLTRPDQQLDTSTMVVTGSAEHNAPSQMAQAVLVQENDRFRTAKREDLQRILDEMKRQQAKEAKLGDLGLSSGLVTGTMLPGLYFQNAFHTFAVILQGILAGFVGCECAVIWLFTGDQASQDLSFLQTYHKYALPMHTIHYVTLMLALVAVLDRYDVGQSFTRVVWRAITFQSGGLSIICNLCALVLSLVTVGIEHRFELCRHNQTHYIMLPHTIDAKPLPLLLSDLRVWRFVLIARAVMVISGWVIIAVRPQTDQLHKHMRRTMEALEMPKTTADDEAIGGQENL